IVRPPPTARVPSCVARREQCASSPVAVAMTSPADMYRINAAECERECARATTLALKRKYQDLAKQWRDMADRAAVRGSKRTQQIEPKAASPERSRKLSTFGHLLQARHPFKLQNQSQHDHRPNIAACNPRNAKSDPW